MKRYLLTALCALMFAGTAMASNDQIEPAAPVTEDSQYPYTWGPSSGSCYEHLEFGIENTGNAEVLWIIYPSGHNGTFSYVIGNENSTHITLSFHDKGSYSIACYLKATMTPIPSVGDVYIR